MYSDHDLTLKEPRLGLEDESGFPSLSPPPYAHDPRNRQKGSFAKLVLIGFLLVLLTVACLAVGFIVGQQYGQQLASNQHALVKEAQSSSCMQYLTQGFSQISKDLEKLQSATPVALPASHSEQPTEELKELKLLAKDLHSNLAYNQETLQSWQDIPAKVRKIETILSKLEASKISIVEELCPASSELPEAYTAKESSTH